MASLSSQANGLVELDMASPMTLAMSPDFAGIPHADQYLQRQCAGYAEEELPEDED